MEARANQFLAGNCVTGAAAAASGHDPGDVCALFLWHQSYGTSYGTRLKASDAVPLQVFCAS